jgi:hypothetical protein
MAPKKTRKVVQKTVVEEPTQNLDVPPQALDVPPQAIRGENKIFPKVRKTVSSLSLFLV